MEKTKRISIDEIQKQVEKQYRERDAVCNKLLENIKLRKAEISSAHCSFTSLEPEYIYRFYHQSFKVFWFADIFKNAKNLFTELAPNSETLNPWFSDLIDKAISAEFDDKTTNTNWVEETRPLLEAFWHSKYFLEQMLVAADELDEAPRMLPTGWAAVLYLYNLR